MSNVFADSLKEFNETFKPTVNYCKLIREEFNEWFDEFETQTNPSNELKELCDMLYVAYGFADVNNITLLFDEDNIKDVLKRLHLITNGAVTNDVMRAVITSAYAEFICTLDQGWLDYFTHGILAYAVTREWDIETAFKRVHESNMSKLTRDGRVVRREDGKVLKSEQYKPADLSDLIITQKEFDKVLPIISPVVKKKTKAKE
jgi:predicted HAD superfamily Cof-like phosphohydrolase